MGNDEYYIMYSELAKKWILVNSRGGRIKGTPIFQTEMELIDFCEEYLYDADVYYFQ